MPSTRKQKAKPRRSNQSDVLSDFENMDVMLGTYSRNELDSDQEETNIEADLGSVGPQQHLNQNSENFRSLLTTNSTENSEITIQTTRLICSEVTHQVTRHLNELRETLNSQY